MVTYDWCINVHVICFFLYLNNTTVPRTKRKILKISASFNLEVVFYSESRHCVKANLYCQRKLVFSSISHCNDDKFSSFVIYSIGTGMAFLITSAEMSDDCVNLCV